jgi:catechol 2,3-dioxygenase-like lactoylglutathione lyase family enzyme
MPVKTRSKKAAKPKAAKSVAKTPAKAKGKPKGLSFNKLGYAIVFVKDMERGVRFYRDTLGIPPRFVDGEWSEFEMVGCTLALHRADEMPKNLDRAPITELCFDTADVRGARAALQGRGVRISELRGVCEIPGGVGASASFRDPDGNHLSIFGIVPKAQWKGPTDES